MLLDERDQARGVGEMVVAERDHRALGSDVDLRDIGLAAHALDGHHLEQLVGFRRQGPEAVDQLGGQRLAVVGAFRIGEAAIEGQADIEVGHIGFRDQHRRAGVDLGRPPAV